MKTKHILAIFLFLSISYSAEAQFFKKLKKKAQQAAERTILKKTDEVVSKKTEQAIDSATTSNPSKTNKNNNEGSAPLNISKMFGGGLDVVPDTYKFSYVCTMKVTTNKDETEMKYLLEPNEKYFGNKMEDGQQNNITVIDMNNKLMVLFSDNGEQKTAMNLPMNNKTMSKYLKKAEQKANTFKSDAKVTSIPGKTILGYYCKGYKITSNEGVTKIWLTDKTPVGFLGSMSNMSNVPDGILPIGKNTMFMEMDHTSNNGKKNAFNMVCTAIDQQNLNINKSEYSSQGFSKN